MAEALRIDGTYNGSERSIEKAFEAVHHALSIVPDSPEALTMLATLYGLHLTEKDKKYHQKAIE